MANERNRRNNNQKNNSANDRVIYLNKRDILNNSRRRTASAKNKTDAKKQHSNVSPYRQPDSSASRARRNSAQNSRSGKRSTVSSSSYSYGTGKASTSRRRTELDYRQGYSSSGRQRSQTSSTSRRSSDTRSAYGAKSGAELRSNTRYGAGQRPTPGESPRTSSRSNSNPNPRTRTRTRTNSKPVNKKQNYKGNGGEIVIRPFRALPPIYFSCNKDAVGEKRSYKKTSRRANNRGMIIIAAIFAVLFLIYIGGYAINMTHTDKIAYETIQIGSVDSAKTAEGVIIRSEKVFTAPASGAVEYAVAENEKIRKGTAVCSISNAQAVAQLQENLDSINDDIMKMQQNRADISEHTEEVNKLEAQIKNITDANTFNFTKGNFDDVYNLKYSVENKLNTRNQLLLSENSGSLSTLVGQRNDELKQINDNIKQVVADVGGIVCYSVDGMEAELTPENAAALTKEQLAKSPQAGGIKTNVAANDPVFKVITSNEWYIAAYLPDTYTEGWETGREMELYLQNGVEANRTIEVTLTALEHKDKESYVLFKTADYMADYMDMRNISFEIDKPKTGYKIPDTAISQQTLLKIPAEYVDTNSNTVVKVSDSGNKTLEITVSGTEKDEKGSYILVPVQIGYLSPGDTLKKGESTLKAEEVVTVDGVFLVNSGVTEFIKINKQNSVAGGGYTVLDSTVNPNINIYDRVVQNVSNVQENQNIYE